MIPLTVSETLRSLARRASSDRRLLINWAIWLPASGYQPEDRPCLELRHDFETQPASGSGKVLFVRAGQDIPLFDDYTLKLLPAKK